MKNLIRKIRWRIYKFGLRPKPGSIWYSPSMDYVFGPVKK